MEGRGRWVACALVAVACGCGDSTGDNDGAGGGGGNGDGGGSTGTSPSVDDCRIFPADNAWNQDVSSLPVHPDSDAYIDWIGRDTTLHPDFGSEYGIPYLVVPGTTPRVHVEFEYEEESDPGPYPIPPDVPVEDGGDKHIVVIDGDACVLYELFSATTPNEGVTWIAGSGAIWDLNINATRPAGWTSADAAGLPIFPGLARYDEVVEKAEVHHALRMTVSSSRAAYIAPASHYASSETDPSAPPMGLRLRMKASYDCSGYSPETQVLCAGFKKYGLIVADNGSDWYITGAPDPRWNDDALNGVKEIPGDAFEAVYTGDPVTD